MKNALYLLLTFFIINNVNSQIIIEMEKVNGIYEIPCKVNGIPMKFIFDTGASDVSISITEAKFLLKQGLLQKEDFIENVNYQMANGDIIDGTKINLRSIEIDGIVLSNVSASVIYQQNAPLLFGQSAISKIGEYTIKENKLIIKNAVSKIENSEIKDRETSTNNLSCNPEIGCLFEGIKDYINLRLEPHANSTTIISPKKESFGLTCVENGINNDFVKVQLYLNDEAFKEKGIDKNIYDFYYNILNKTELSLKNYFKLISNDVELRKTYNVLKKNKSFENWSDDQDFSAQMKTFESFKKYWIRFDKDKIDLNYIIENQDRIVYVNKSDIINYFGPIMYSLGEGIEYYQKKVDEYTAFKETNSCAYDENTLFVYFDQFIKKTILANSFLALQKINQYYGYFESTENIIKIEELKMYASYEDKNYEGTETTAKKIISNFKEKKEYIVFNGKVQMYNFINLDEVYGYLISSLLKLNKVDEAYILSNECLADERIQFKQFLDFHTIILKKLNKTDELCELLNKEYLKGNAKAKKLKIENCK